MFLFFVCLIIYKMYFVPIIIFYGHVTGMLSINYKDVIFYNYNMIVGKKNLNNSKP